MIHIVAVVQDINPLHWTRTQEVSNGRAAIAGLIAAFISERATGFATVDQLLGSSADAPWAKPAFFAVVLTFIAITGSGESLHHSVQSVCECWPNCLRIVQKVVTCCRWASV
jgi:hypothetical protein